MPYIISRTLPEVNSTEYLKPMYETNDLSRIFVHYDKSTGRNIATENKILKEENNNG